MFFLAYIGLYRTPAGWYGQKLYLGPGKIIYVQIWVFGMKLQNEALTSVILVMLSEEWIPTDLKYVFGPVESESGVKNIEK